MRYSELPILVGDFREIDMKYARRKFRSQTSDNMDRWKSRGGKRQRREEKKREDQRRERVRRKKMQAREKVEKSRNTVFFQTEGRKVGLLKRRVRSQFGQMRDENFCTVLWREAHFEVKMCKAHQRWSTFRSWAVEKARAVVARSIFPSQNVQAHQLRSTFWSWDVEKVHAVVARSTFPSQNVENTTCSDRFWRFRWGFALQVQGILHLAKNGKRDGFVAYPNTMAGVGHLKRIWKDAFRVAGAVQQTCSSEILGGLGTDFLRGFAFWSIRSSGLPRWFCVTGAALRMTWHHFFVAGAVLYTDGALNLLFLKEVSQNCRASDVVEFKNGGIVAE